MCATNSPLDKYAFLFRTNTSVNLSDVKDTLINLYGYPAANIVESIGCSNITADFQSIASTIAEHIPAGTLPQGQVKKNTFVVFICGNADNNGLNDGTGSIDWDNLGYALDPPGSPYYNNSEVHFFLIFPYCDNMISHLTSLQDGSINLPVCLNFDAFNNQIGYLTAWKQAFDTDAVSLFNPDKLLTFHAAAGKIYNLGNIPSSPLESFYKQKLAGADDIFFQAEYYPGYPSIEIDDGNPWYKTNDIWLNDLDPLDNSIPQADRDLYDNYEANRGNKISVRIHIRGTHPVKEFNVGVGVFRTGGGGDCDVNPTDSRLVNSAQLLKPGDNYTYSYNEFFEPQYSHRCIKARASIKAIMDSELDEDIDWDIIGRLNEAQLNIDPGGVAKSAIDQGEGDTGAVEPGQGQVDEDNPGEDAEPDTAGDGTGSKSLKNLRGYFEHVYHIKNRLKTTKEFRITLPPVLGKYRELIKCRWFMPDSKYFSRLKELIPRGIDKNYISLTLRSGASVDLVLFMQIRDVEKLSVTNIPFDILVETNLCRIPLKGLFRFVVKRRFKQFAGVNVVLSNSSGNIRVKVVDTKNNPVPDAYVFIKTLDGRQSAALKTKKDGICEIPGINTGSYKVWAKFKGEVTKERIVNLHNRKTESVDLKFGG